MRLSLPLKYLCESKTVVYENRRVYEDRNYGNQCMRIEASPSTGQNRFPLVAWQKKKPVFVADMALLGLGRCQIDLFGIQS